LPSEPYLFGVWEGEMSVIEERADGDPATPPFQGERFPFRVDIKNTNLIFYFRGQDGWLPIGDGSDLRLNQAGRSAIVVAALPAGELTETWMLNLVRWDEATLLVYLSRLLSRDGANSQPPVSFGAIGQMTRLEE
jgi:hypothetical protein